MRFLLLNSANLRKFKKSGFNSQYLFFVKPMAQLFRVKSTTLDTVVSSETNDTIVLCKTNDTGNFWKNKKNRNQLMMHIYSQF